MIVYSILTKINNNNKKKKKKKKKLLLLLCFYEFSNALITDASVSFPTLFIWSLGEVHRSSAKSHRLFFPVFILRIRLDLGLDDFPAFEPVHIIAPIGATFLRQRAAQLKVSSKRPYVKSSTGDASRAPPSVILLLRLMWTPQLSWFLHHLHLVTLSCVLCWIRFSSFKLHMDNSYWMCSMMLQPYEQSWRLLEVLLHRLHPLRSHDCLLAICHKMGEYIEIWGEIFFWLDYI